MWRGISSGERASREGDGQNIAITAASIAILGGALGILALLVGATADNGATTDTPHPVWTEAQWPFPKDQWGGGKAFRCKAANCGADTSLYLRAKLGFCNCTTGIADDEDLDRMSDFDLVGGEVLPLGAGRPITVGRMQGRARAYSLPSRDAPGQSVISVVFNDRCDMAVATVVLAHREPARIESGVLEFLNSGTALRWVETTLGL